MVVLSPLQMVASVTEVVISGNAFTLTVMVAEFVHPLSVPVTVYVVVVDGLTEYEELLPSEWLQLYVVPPVALMVVLPPSQMVGIVAEAPIDGASFTVTVTVATSVHPLVVPVTVYVVVEDGDAEKEDPLPDGLHE